MAFGGRDVLGLLQELNDGLAVRGLDGEIGIVGGSAMVLLFDNRKSTKDVDAVFEPKSKMSEIAAEIAKRRGLPADWLNDSVKGFLTDNIDRVDAHDFSNLRVWLPTPEYLLAMKVLSSRVDSYDGEDIRILIDHLNLSSPNEVFDIVENYYPRSRIEPKAQYFVEDLFDD